MELTLVETGERRNGNGNGDGGGRREFYVDPKPGMYPAICVDVIDLGFKKNSFNKVTRKIQFAFQLGTVIDEKMIVAAKKLKGLPAKVEEDDKELLGKRVFVRGKQMSFSLFPGGENMKSSDLYSFLEDWNGAPFAKPTKENPLRFNAEEFIGKNATLMIVRNPDKKDPSIVYSNITAIMPPEEDAEVLTLDDTYTRVKDRDNYKAPPTEAEASGGVVATSAPAETASTSDEDVEIPYDKAA